ncbi:LysR family transcriptional regulator [Sodalis ligni]|uniref:LysR family transcriptional regulator n=1 Tax=Sodalis ligni TaxID=2697027 RepID=UPI00193EF1EF|nr:LysR family transcriptional regulator [Sodalis ligni]QWA13093.1 LysR family transcriptional regulator [Sodalis ligni]
MNYSLRQLRVFVAIARHGSFSRAGETIGLSQSAVSHSIKELEKEVGVTLLDRTTREVVLTEAGQRLVSRLERALDELNTTLQDARHYGQQRSGKVHVAASPTISAHLMPQCLSVSEKLYPGIKVRLRDRPQQWVLESIRNAEVDFGIVIDPIQTADLYCQPVLLEPFLLLCRSDHPFAGQKQVSWQSLNGCRLVLQDYASGSRALLDEALRQQGINAEIVQEIGHPATLFPMVEAGIGISIVPALALPLPAGSSLVVRALQPEINRSLMLARRKNRTLSPAGEVIWEVVQQQAALLTQRRARHPFY